MSRIESPALRTSLAQALAVQSQVHLSGTVGRLLKQIRDLERLGPLFEKTGLIRKVERPHPLDLRASGISGAAHVARAMGGFLYTAAAVRVDLAVDRNLVSSSGHDSICEIDDIDFEDQAKRFQLIGIRQAYELAHRMMESGERADVVLFDTPLILNRSMVPMREGSEDSGYVREYKRALETVAGFWNSHREKLFPWNPNGTVIGGVIAGRYGAIVQISQQDLRTIEGRRHLLPSDEIDLQGLEGMMSSDRSISGIGERRFLNGILGSYTRTAAFRLNEQTPRMEPREVADLGVIGFHYRAGPGASPKMLELVGNEEAGWNRHHLDRIAGWLMALTVTGGPEAAPLPVQLADRELKALKSFLSSYSRTVRDELKRRDIEDLWLSDLETAE